jgi:predicted dinucleotide-binding enzyme
VGRALGVRLAQLGHTITYGVRDPTTDKAQAVLQAAGGAARAATVAQAVRGAEVVVLATSWEGAPDALRTAGDLGNAVLMDATNPFEGGALAVGHTRSGGELVAGWAQRARVVKAFNSTGSSNMMRPQYDEQRPTMFLCGDDADAKRIVAGLTEQLGFEPCDCGALVVARYLEPLAGLWVQLAYREGLGPDIAFKLLRR